MEDLIALSSIQDNLRRIAVALEGILDRMTPAEERAKTYIVNGYVRSANNGGDLVWLYGAHPGLQYKVATVYNEDFPLLRPFVGELNGRVFDGEVAPSREGALKKGYMIEVPTFEVVLAPTGKRTDAGLMIYDFKTARALAIPEPSLAPPEPETRAPAQETKAPVPSTAADAEWEKLRSASLDLPPQAERKPKPVGPVISGSAIKDKEEDKPAAKPVKMEFGTVKFVPACKQLLDQIGQAHPDKVQPYRAKAGVGYDWEHVQWACGALPIWGEGPAKVTDANWEKVLVTFEEHILK